MTEPTAQRPEAEVSVLKLSGPSIRSFTYVLIDPRSRRAAVVDPAWDPVAIAARVEALGAVPTAILLTHAHFDHVNAVTPLVARYGVEAYMSGREIDDYGFRCKGLRAVEHGDAIRVGDLAVDCVATPGHTSGGLCFRTGGALFTGDTLFTEGCGVCTAPGGDPWAMYRSLALIRRSVPPAARVFPGHSFGMAPGRPLADLLRDNVYFQLDDPEQFVAWRMRPLPASALETR